MKAKPRPSNYGGTADATQEYRENFGDQVDAGSVVTGAGISGLDSAGQAASKSALTGNGMLVRARDTAVGPAYTSSNTAGQILDGYTPGAVSETAARQAVDRNGAATLAAGSRGGALGLRDALNANAASAPALTQAIASQRAQEEQDYLGAQVANAQTNEQINQAGYQDQQARLQNKALTLGSIGAGMVNTGNSQAITANQGITGAGLTQQGTYLDALQDVNNNQLQADIDYDTRRQQETQRRRDNIFGFAGGMLSAGGNMMSMGMGGKK